MITKRIKFLQDWSFKPHVMQTIIYEAGQTYRLKKEWAEKALSLGVAEETDFPTPKKGVLEDVNETNDKGKSKNE